MVWNGLSASYTPDELALMARLKRSGTREGLAVVHALKALFDATLIEETYGTRL